MPATEEGGADADARTTTERLLRSPLMGANSIQVESKAFVVPAPVVILPVEI